MKILKEITDWDTPNHTYFVSDAKDKIFAYIKASGTEVEEFKKPIKFSTSHRKFKELDNTYGYTPPDELPEGFIKIVLGSKGERYQITEVDGVRKCTCAGYRFRGSCRHTTI